MAYPPLSHGAELMGHLTDPARGGLIVSCEVR
jgi:hypothetical protein